MNEIIISPAAAMKIKKGLTMLTVFLPGGNVILRVKSAKKSVKAASKFLFFVIG
jgi:hypothetical protein